LGVLLDGGTGTRGWLILLGKMVPGQLPARLTRKVHRHQSTVADCSRTRDALAKFGGLQEALTSQRTPKQAAILKCGGSTPLSSADDSHRPDFEASYFTSQEESLFGLSQKW